MIRVHPGKSVAQLMAMPHVARALRFFETHADAITEEHIRICTIPASPFGEQERAEYLSRKFSELGLTEVEIDEEGNCLGLLQGSSRSPLIVVSAHLDTVFVCLPLLNQIPRYPRSRRLIGWQTHLRVNHSVEGKQPVTCWAFCTTARTHRRWRGGG